MKQSDISSQEFLAWWQNRFPSLACITAPYSRILITRKLQFESCLTLRVAFCITRLRNLEDYLDHSEQLNWLTPEAREQLLEDLACLGMDALVEHLSKGAFDLISDKESFQSIAGELKTRHAVIPKNQLKPVTDTLNQRLDKYFNNHRALLIDDMESVTGKTADSLPKKIRISASGSKVIEFLSLPYVMKFLRFIEEADRELCLLKEQILTPDVRVAPLLKRKFLDFRIDVNRHFQSFDMEVPEIAEEWLYQVFELFERYPNYFGK